MEKSAESCTEILALLSDYLNFELPPGACAEVEHHLAGCTACDEFAHSLRETVALCRQYEPNEMPAPLSQQARTDLEAAWRRVLAERQQA